MGSSESKVEIVREEAEESEASIQAALRSSLSGQLEGMKADVVKVSPEIKEHVIETVQEIADAILIRYHQLDDIQIIAENIQQIFGSKQTPQVTSFLVDTATRMIAAMNNTEQMKEVMRWQKRKQIMSVGDRVVGMEAHYQVKLLEEKTKHYISKDSKDTVVIIGYKILVHSLEVNPEKVLSSDELKSLSF
jgi:signal recognition particle GTPase